MRLRLFIDGIPREIDSTDPDLLARWIVEIFARLREIYRGTIIELQTWPSVLYNEQGQLVADWAADSRIIGRITKVRTPRELLDAMSQQLDELGALTDGQ